MVMTGRLAALVALGIPLVLLTDAFAAVFIWLGLCLFLWALDSLLAPSPRQLIVSRNLPVALRLRETIGYSLMVRNPTGKKYRVYLRDSWPPSLHSEPSRHKVKLHANTTVKLPATFTPERKGTLPSHSVTVRSFGPLGLGARQFTAALQQSVTVLPQFRSAKYLPSRLMALKRLEGNTLLTQRGQGSEFDSLREYVPGDDVRDIEWHASARMRTPVVKTWRPERDRNVVICLDISRNSATRLGEYPRLDAQIEAALFLGALAASAGDRVHLLAVSNRIQLRTELDRGPHLMPEMAQLMAQLEASLTESNWIDLSQMLLSTMRQRSLVVLLTGITAGSAHSTLMPAVESLSGTHHLIVASAQDPEVQSLTKEFNNATNAYLATAAMSALNETSKASELLSLLGAQVLHTTPDLLPVTLGDAYISLKRNGSI